MIRPFLICAAFVILAACDEDTSPKASTETSPNGTTFTLLSVPEQDSVTIHVAWPTDWGFRAETNKAAPLIGADLILAGGADGFAAGEVGERFADINSEGLLYVGINDHIIGELTFELAHREETIAMAAAHLQAPSLDQMWFDRIKDGLQQNMAEAQAQPTHASYDAVRWAVFGEQPLRNALSLDDPATFETITRDDIVAWRQEVFTNTPEAIVVAGNITAADAGTAIDTLLTGLPTPSIDLTRTAMPDASPKRILLHQPDAEITNLAFIGLMPPSQEGGEFEDLLLVHALGGGDQSVLFEAVRTNLRATYGFNAGQANYTRDLRILVMTGEVETAKLTDVETTVRQAYTDFRANGLPGDLADHKALHAPTFANLTDFVVDLARTEMQGALDGSQPGRSLQLAAEIDAITEDSIAARLQDAYPTADDFIVVAVSPDATALPDACVITTPQEAVSCP